jgi:hypothetical protein
MTARKLLVTLALSLAAFVTTSAFAQAPAGSTGECKDGTYTSAKSKRGACAGHGGVKTWLAEDKPAAKSPKASTHTSKPAAETHAPKAGAEKSAPASSAKAGEAAAGSTGECKDGTYTSAKSKRGACAGHGGVKTWFADAKSAPSSAKPSASAPTVSQAPASKPAPVAKEPAPAARTSAKSQAAPVETKEGAGPGMVWVNTPSGVYHCSGDQWYGKTKKGEYMSEAQAKSKGYRASRNKPCS